MDDGATGKQAQPANLGDLSYGFNAVPLVVAMSKPFSPSRPVRNAWNERIVAQWTGATPDVI
jgi:hypothetical protein